MEERDVGRARQAVVHEGGREKLAVGIEDGVLVKRLADPLDDAAMDLAFEQERVQGDAEIVDDDIGHDLRLAGVRVDLNLADMGAVRVGGLGRRPFMRRGQAVGTGLFAACEVGEGDGAVGAGDAHGALRKLEIGDAGLERIVYDPEGQLVTASLTDYRLPRAADIPEICFETRNVPSTTNIMGMKGAGEAGAIGACPAVMNAVVDALHRACGIRHIDMPATPDRVFAAIRATRGEEAA